MPKLSPASEGAQSTSASRKLAPEDRVRDLAEHVDVGHHVRDRLRAGRSPRDPRRRWSGGRGRARPSASNAASRTGSPLRSSARPTKSSRSSSLGASGPRGAASMSTPLGMIVVLAAEPAPPRPGGGLGDGDARGELVEAPARAEQGGDRDSGRPWSSRRGTCRRPARSRKSIASQPTIGARRLVHVDDVVVAGAELAAQSDGALGEDREVGDGAVGADPDGPPERDQVVGRLPQLGMGAVQASADGVRRIPGGQARERGLRGR